MAKKEAPETEEEFAYIRYKIPAIVKQKADKACSKELTNSSHDFAKRVFLQYLLDKGVITKDDL